MRGSKAEQARFRRNVVKLVAFAVVSVVLTTVVIATLLNLDTGGTRNFRAVFADASGLQPGDIVAIAGVEVGKVGGIRLSRDRALVSFTVDHSQELTTTTHAVVGFENLLGNRYLDLTQSGQSGTPLRSGATIPEARTSGGLNLTDLFDGFQPLFAALQPSQVNQLAASVIAVFQGQSSALDGLLSQTASLTTNLADRGQLITEVIDNLTPLLQQVSAHDTQLGSLISGLTSFVGGLSADRGQINAAISSVGNLTTQLSGVLGKSQPSLNSDIDGLATATGALAHDQGSIDSALSHLTPFVATLAKVADSGSFLSVYVCNLTVETTGPLHATLVPGYTGTLDLPVGPVGDQSQHTANCR